MKASGTNWASPAKCYCPRDYDMADSRDDIIATASKLKELGLNLGSIRN